MFNNVPDALSSWLASNSTLDQSRNRNTTVKTPSEFLTYFVDVQSVPIDFLLPESCSIDLKEDKTRTGSDKSIDAAQSRGLTCLTCRLSFDELLLQHEHFKSLWHKTNLQRKLRGHGPMSQDEFVNVSLEETNSSSSLSASKIVSFHETSEENLISDEDAEDYDRKELVYSTSEDEKEELFFVEDEYREESHLRYEYNDEIGSIRKLFNFDQRSTKTTNAASGPTFLFQMNRIKPWSWSCSTALFYRNSLFSQRDWNQNPESFILWKQLREQLQCLKSKPMTAVIILRSGRFAGAIYDCTPNCKQPLIAHKVMRRYTVRAKAGGGQSSHDNKGSKAKSAGAMLRRYGEQALKEDVHTLLTSWQDYFSACGLILLATTKTMRGILFDDDSSRSNVSLLKKDDPRVISVPFPVDKPTLEATQLIRDNCLRLQFTNKPFLSSEVVANFQAPLNKIQSTNGGDAKSEQVKTSSDTTVFRLPDNSDSKRLIQACRSEGDHSASMVLVDLIEKYTNLSPGAEEGEEADDGSANIISVSLDLMRVLSIPDSVEDLLSPLHIAAANGLCETVQKLLLAGANPEQCDARGRTPYFLAERKEIRDAFRRARAELGESRWNWQRSGVPEPLTDEKVALQKQKEKEKKKRAQQRKKDAKARAEQEAEDALLAKKLQEEIITKERAEREERNKLIAGNCENCGKSLYRHEYYDVLDKRCCSTECVMKIRRKLASEAAMARMHSK